MEEEEETELSRIDSWMQSTVPSIPKFLAIICLVLNIVIPGSGTFAGGLMSCCCGRPRIEFRPAKYRCPVALVVMIIGVMQLLSTAFFLVGWLWSIIWGFLMVNLSGAEFRKMAPVVVPLPPEIAQRRASKLSVKIEETDPPGKKNFSRLINKAGENKELAMFGSGSLSSSSNDINKSASPSKANSNSSLQNTSPIPASRVSTPKASTSKEDVENSIKSKTGSATSESRSSIFSCFSQKHKKFITDKIEKFLIRGQSESSTNLLEIVENGGTVKFKSTAHKLFTHWRINARKLARLRKVGEQSLEDVEAPTKHGNRKNPSPILITPQNSRDSSETTNSVHFEIPISENDTSSNKDQIILDPSTLPKLTNPRITLAKPVPDTNSDQQDKDMLQESTPPKGVEMKPRITQSHKYHFAV